MIDALADGNTSISDESPDFVHDSTCPEETCEQVYPEEFELTTVVTPDIFPAISPVLATCSAYLQPSPGADKCEAPSVADVVDIVGVPQLIEDAAVLNGVTVLVPLNPMLQSSFVCCTDAV